MTAARFPPGAGPWRGSRASSLTRLAFSELAGFCQDDHLKAFKVFARSCGAIVEKSPPLRRTIACSAALEAIAHEALVQDFSDGKQARRFFEVHFQPYRIAAPCAGAGTTGFLTGYYEPIVEGSLTRSRDFPVPVLARPDNLAALAPYPDRAAIEAGVIDRHTAPLVWLRDHAEVFLVQVQGSARVRLADGRIVRLLYAGRNCQPYTSIGRILIECGEIAEADMSLAALKLWIRAHGQNPGDAGFELMQRNKSYVFFSLGEEDKADRGPIGGQGVSLTALRSLAIDRTIWAYGLPFWIAAELPWRERTPSPFRRLMIAQDTGSAITGPVRCDVFFGSGDDAGARAGDIRHVGEVIVLLPIGEAPP